MVKEIKSKNDELFQFIGKKIRQKRKEIKVTQGTIANLLDISDTQIFKFETGESKIALDYLLKLAEFFNVPLEYFYSDFEGKNKLENQSVVKYPSNTDLDKAILAAKEIYEFGDEDLIVGVNNCINTMQVILKKRKNDRRNPNPVKRKRLAGNSK